MAIESTANADHLTTDHLVHNLGERALSGGLVTFAAQGLKFVLNLGSAALLARLLSPNDFGVVGMVLAITSLLALFKDAGLSAATIQREQVTQDQVSNLFWLNAVFGGLVCVVSIAFAPLVAWFYRDPRLTHIMWLLSLTFLLTASTVQHQALLTRQMRFKALAVIEVTSMLAGVILGACMALLGFGYWALVGMQLCLAVATLILTWITSGWFPTAPKRNSDVRSFLRFGLHLTAADLVGSLTANADSMLIGRLFGASALGLYSRANVLLNRPLQQIINPVSAVLVPVLSRLQSDPARYRRTFLRVYDAIVFITFPCAAVALVLAEPLVLLVLGPQWKGAIPLFAGFALVAVTAPMTFTPSWLFVSQGRGRDQLYSYLIAGPVTVVAYLVGLHWGPIGVILSLAIANPAVLLPVVYYVAGRSGPVRAADMWTGLFAFLPCWGAAYAVASLAYHATGHAAPLVQLVVCGPVGLAAGLCAALCFKRPRATALEAWLRIRNIVDPLVRRSGNKNSMPATEQKSTSLGHPVPLSSKRSKIALYGIFGVENIGNEYTLQAMLYNVRLGAPEAEVYSICYGPQDTESLHGLPALPVKCERLSRHYPPASNVIVQLFRGAFRRIPLELYDWLRAFWVLRGTNLMIMTGTGMLTDYCVSSFGFPYDVFKWSVAAKIARCKVRFVGIGVGPIYSRLSRIFIKTALTVADYRGFRDEQSRNRLKQYGFERANDSVFPDLAFSLPPSALPASNDRSGAKTVVGIGVMKFVDVHKGEMADYDAAYDRYLEKMCDFTIWLLKHGYAVRILEGDLRYDPPVRVDMKARLGRRGIVYGIDDVTNPPIAGPQELLEHLASADFIV
jgi:O-antigen/teichoic acid export membrane protein/polysaccharide pyruvyl transferase WcaK-like protein